ncbi:MAG: biotin--[acetyl-CoA-carboxylase] ligase [Ignavibacteriae bacterium HGW-Ignavibacteriae-4]|jgi:BirA family biotin operon repressor/biotin-[acetyl-CoA-carboxylase] ligase|nr:MAG: biotin--[acetyl-CoA-carboxylase] ligase [Ignavibacteriae bacterium HGW-Ignavibacteriae-4]
MMDIQHYHFERVASTNDVAKELLTNHDSVFVSADYQYKGRGRKGRIWEGESHKNVYLTYGVNEQKIKSLKNKVLYQIIGCLAVVETLSTFIESSKIKLKYPNDVYVNDGKKYRKISGVLSEHSYSGNICEESILGIGINVNQMEFGTVLDDKATSLKKLGLNCEIELVLETLKRNVIKFLDIDENIIFENWKSKIDLIGKSIKLVENQSQYTVDLINIDGSLMASNQNGTISINNGDSIIYEL